MSRCHCLELTRTAAFAYHILQISQQLPQPRLTIWDCHCCRPHAGGAAVPVRASRGGKEGWHRVSAAADGPPAMPGLLLPPVPAAAAACPSCLPDAPLPTPSLLATNRSKAASSLVFSPDAQHLLVVGGDAVAVLDAGSRAEQQRLAIPSIMAAALSPKGTYLITFQRPSKDESGQGELAVLESRCLAAAGSAGCRGCRFSSQLP